MKERMAEFAFYAFPSYWTLALTILALFVRKTPLMNPDLLSLVTISATILIAAFLLTKKCRWIVLPMIALAVFIALHKDGYTDHIVQLFGIFTALHYIACGAYALKHRNDTEG